MTVYVNGRGEAWYGNGPEDPRVMKALAVARAERESYSHSDLSDLVADIGLIVAIIGAIAIGLIVFGFIMVALPGWASLAILVILTIVGMFVGKSPSVQFGPYPWPGDSGGSAC